MSDLVGIRVLVTGGGGFIGSHLVEYLSAQGASVTALVQYNSRGSIGWLEKSSPESENRWVTVSGNLCDVELVKSLVSKVDVVLNLAALIGIPYSYRAPRSYFEVNVLGTLNVLEALRGRNDCLLIQMSTSEVYGSAKTLPIAESHPLQAQSPYSASKIGAEAAVMSYHASFDTPVIIPRVFNNYGPRQSERAIIPTIIAQALSRAKSIRLGNLETSRDFVYVEDTCRMLCELVQKQEQFLGTTVNIGTGSRYSIGDVANVILSMLNVECEIEIDPERVRPSASEVNNLECDNSMLSEILGPVKWTSLEDGLQKTIQWMEQRSGADSRDKSQYVV